VPCRCPEACRAARGAPAVADCDDEKGEPGTGNVVIAAGAGLSVMMMVEGSEGYVVIGDRWPRGFESAADRPVIATKPSGGPGDAREEGLGPVQ